MAEKFCKMRWIDLSCQSMVGQRKECRACQTIPKPGFANLGAHRALGSFGVNPPDGNQYQKQMKATIRSTKSEFVYLPTSD